MAKKGKDATVTLLSAPPPSTETGAPATEPQTPVDIATAFKQAVGEVEVEQNVKLKATGAKAVSAAPPVVVAPAPTWTPGGVGRAGVHLTNIALGASDFELLEPEEEQGLAEDVAYYLSVRWPSGSKWEPEARILARLAEVWGPRLGARYKAQREEAARLDREAAELEAQGHPKPGPGKMTTTATAGSGSAAGKTTAKLPTGEVVEVPSGNE